MRRQIAPIFLAVVTALEYDHQTSPIVVRLFNLINPSV